MQEHFRFTLFIIGICIIGGILLHGMWSIRQSSKKSKRNSFESRNWEPEFEHEDDLEAQTPIFDDVGVSKARIIAISPNSNQDDDSISANEQDEDNATDDLDGLNNGQSANLSATEQDAQNLHAANESSKTSELDPANDDNSKNQKVDDHSLNENLSEETLREDAINDDEIESEPSPVYSNVVTQPKPEFNRPIVNKQEAKDDDFGQPPGFLLKQNDNNAPNAVNSAESDNSGVNAPQTDANTPDFSLNIQDGPVLTNDGAPNTKPHIVSADEATAVNPVAASTANEKPGVEKELSFAEQAKRFVRRNKKTVADKIRKEPVLKAGPSDDQMRIDFDTSAAAENGAKTSDSRSEQTMSSQSGAESNTAETNQSASTATDVLVLNVRANNDKAIEGAALLPMLLTLGFKFGEHDIFHRHVNTNGKGPILFSLTNMFKPGVFDIDNIENFKTLGISLFMMLPIEGDAQQVFNMMHNAARKLSDEFDCRILDGNKVGLSKQSLQQYVERIREFERKRLNR